MSYFHRIGPLGRFCLLSAMSVCFFCLFVVLCHLKTSTSGVREKLWSYGNSLVLVCVMTQPFFFSFCSSNFFSFFFKVSYFLKMWIFRFLYYMAAGLSKRRQRWWQTRQRQPQRQREKASTAAPKKKIRHQRQQQRQSCRRQLWYILFLMFILFFYLFFRRQRWRQRPWWRRIKIYIYICWK